MLRNNQFREIADPASGGSGVTLDCGTKSDPTGRGSLSPELETDLLNRGKSLLVEALSLYEALVPAMPTAHQAQRKMLDTFYQSLKTDLYRSNPDTREVQVIYPTDLEVMQKHLVNFAFFLELPENQADIKSLNKGFLPGEIYKRVDKWTSDCSRALTTDSKLSQE